MRVMTPEEKAEEVKMMQAMAEWPLFPLLPVKRRKGNGQFPDCAVMTALTGWSVLECSIDEILKDPNLINTAKRLPFADATAAVEAGWVVD